MHNLVLSGMDLENLMAELRKEMEDKPPLRGSYQPRKNDVCASRFSQDRLWYRAKIEKIEGNMATVFFIDYGNVSNLCPLF